MTTTWLLVLSITVQVAAAVVALAQIRTTHRRLGWSLLSVAFVLMAARRAVTLDLVLQGNLQAERLTAIQEIVALSTSLLLFAGVLAMGALFRQTRATNETLRIVSRQHEKILEAAGEGILGTDSQGHATFINPTAARMIGWDPGEVIGRKWHDLVHYKHRDGTPFPAEDCPIVKTLLFGERVSDGADMYWRRDGGPLPVEYVATPILESGKPAGAVLTFRDVSERLRSEEATRRLVQFLRTSSTIASSLLGDGDPNTASNSLVAELGGAAGASRCFWFERTAASDGRWLLTMRAEWCAPGVTSWLGDPAVQAIPEALTPTWEKHAASGRPVAAKTSESEPEERAILELFGIKSILVVPLEVGTRVAGFIGFDDCTTERVWSEDETHLLSVAARAFALAIDRWEQGRQRNRLAEVVEQASEGVLITDRNGTIEYANPALCRLSGFKARELVGMNLDALSVPEPGKETSGPHREVLREHRPWSGLHHCRTAQGDTVACQATLFPLTGADGATTGMTALLLDTTEQRRLEEQLRRIQKLDALGHFASGIAHDFSNLVMVIASAASMAQSRAGTDSPIQEDLAAIARAADRGAGLAKGLLGFARPRPMRSESIDVNELVGDILPLLRRVVPESITLTFSPDEKAGIVRVDRGQIDQVVMNLCINARDAMLSGGTLTLATGTAVRESASGGGKTGGLVTLSVADTGTGMDSATVSRLFEPFFSTKGPSAGSGLGLATAYAIVKEHGGAIEVSSEPGKGSTFLVLLPVATEQSAPQPQPATLRPATGTESVMLVEDNHDLRVVVSQILSSLGYRVTEVCDGVQALSLLDSGPAFDLVVSDVVMPRMSGTELYQRVRQTKPGVCFLMTSGYPDAGMGDESFRDDPLLGFIRKPYSLGDLASSIRLLLSARVGPAQ